MFQIEDDEDEWPTHAEFMRDMWLLYEGGKLRYKED